MSPPHRPTAESSPLACRDSVAPAELAAERWVVRPDGPLRELVDRVAGLGGFTCRITHETSDNHATRQLVADGHAVTLAGPALVPGVRPAGTPLLAVDPGPPRGLPLVATSDTDGWPEDADPPTG